MRVLILNQFFYPDISATSQLMTDLAQDLASHGLSVTALCANTSYVGGERLPKSEKWGEVGIERVSVVAFARENILRRLASYLSFYVTAFFRLLRLPRQDVILVLTTPPLIALVAYALRVLRGSKMVYLVQDVYPDIAYQFGLMRRGSLGARVLDSISGFLLRKADAIIALGSCMKRRLVEKGVAAERITVIANWADGQQIRPIRPEANPLRAAQGLEGKFVVLYSGNMGRAHEFEAIFAAMVALAPEKQIVFLFVGGGPKRREVEEFARLHPEVNLRVADYVPRAELGLSMGLADLSLLSVAEGLEGLVVPSKLYGIMASGRPALYLGPPSSEAAETIEKHGCGFVIPNGDAAGVTQAILRAFREPAETSRMGEAARAAFERHFDRPLAAAQYLSVLQGVLPPQAARGNERYC